MSQLRPVSLPEKGLDEWNRQLSRTPDVVRPKNPRPRRLFIVFSLAALTIVAVALVSIVAAWPSAPAPAAAPPSGRLSIDTRPAGASIFVDDVAKGPAPLTLAAGPHRIRVRHGAATRDLPITVRAGEHVSQHIEFHPAPITGRLQIETDPVGAQVLIDDTLRGTSPLAVEDLAPGPHAVVVQSAIGSVTRTVTVEAGATAFLIVPLVAKGAPLSGWVAVSSPVELQIFEGGRLIGTTATDRVMMPAGRHELRLANEALGYQEDWTVTVVPGKTVTVPLELPDGTLHVNASPWADVWIDGKRVGETPLGNLRVPIGRHEILFRHPQLGEQRHAVTVSVSNPARLSVDLAK